MVVKNNCTNTPRKFERRIFGQEIPADHWFSRNKLAQALAEKINQDLLGVGLDNVSKVFYVKIYNYFYRNRCLEYKFLAQQQKTAFGEYLERVLISLLRWKKNPTGLDVTFRLIVDGEEVEVESDIKSSSSTINRPKEPKETKKGKKPRRRRATIEDNKPIPLGQQISLESRDKINVLISVDTYNNNISIGILDCSQEGFVSEIKKHKKDGAPAGGPARDLKSPLTTEGKWEIVWIVFKLPIDPNPLLPLGREVRLLWGLDDRNYMGLLKETVETLPAALLSSVDGLLESMNEEQKETRKKED
jgi:hypothetical protein